LKKQEKAILSFIGAILGIIFIVFGGLWLYEGSFTLTITKYSTFLNLFLTSIIALITILYYLATKNIADSTNESARASREIAETTIMLEKEKLTYELIREWSYDKKLLTLKREKIGEHFLNVESGMFDYKKGIEFIEYFNSFFDYFTIVDGLMENKKINKELYLKILSREIVNFWNNEYEDNNKVVSKIRDKYRKDGRNLPVISTFDALRKIVNLAEDEIKVPHTNYF